MEVIPALNWPIRCLRERVYLPRWAFENFDWQILQSSLGLLISSLLISIEMFTQTGSDPVLFIDNFWLQHGSVHIAEKRLLNWLYLVETRNKPFSIGDVTLTLSSALIHLTPFTYLSFFRVSCPCSNDRFNKGPTYSGLLEPIQLLLSKG